MTVVEAIAAVVAGLLGLVVLSAALLAVLIAGVFADDAGAWVGEKTPDLLLKVVGIIVLIGFASFILFLSYSVGLGIIEWVGEVLA